MDLWAYLVILQSNCDRSDWWKTYDSRFEQQMPSLEKAEFRRLD